MSTTSDTARERILQDIDHASEPAKMSKQEALEWLEGLITELESRAEALREELGEDEGEDDEEEGDD